MNRRDFMQTSSAVAIVTGFGAAELRNIISTDSMLSLEYKGVRLVWSGWIASSFELKLVGYWSGTVPNTTKKGEWFYYAAYPGIQGIELVGAHMLTSLQSGQIIPTINEFLMDKALMTKLREDALKRIKEVIDKDLENNI